MTFDLARYLDRINHAAEPPSVAALMALQTAQMLAIAFENTEVLLGRVPDLEPASIWRKLVEERRGGYCLELNALFGSALGALGYTSRPVLGRVRMGAPTGGPRAHLAHIVTLDGQDWLADTGFGGPGPAHPLPCDHSEPVDTPQGRYRLRHDPEAGEEVLEREMPGGVWFALYGFDRVPVTPPDIEAANVVCARWDLAPFPHHLMMSRLTTGGRYGLFDTALTGPQGQSRHLTSAAHLGTVLTALFGLPADLARDEAIWHRIAPEPLKEAV